MFAISKLRRLPSFARTPSPAIFHPASSSSVLAFAWSNVCFGAFGLYAHEMDGSRPHAVVTWPPRSVFAMRSLSKLYASAWRTFLSLNGAAVLFIHKSHGVTDGVATTRTFGSFCTTSICSLTSRTRVSTSPVSSWFRSALASGTIL